ncbi:MAG TPA: cation:dicarboxylase symporter family transporter [Gemmatimonadaceae bacterium]|nr:cation:dicarboxylase symporter family transporter [Gemmatimonadaceae bacterium]
MRARRVVIGLVAGLIVGSIVAASNNAAAARVAALLNPIGQLWVNAIRMTIVPLVVSLLFVSVASLDASDGLGRIGVVTLVTFFGLLAFAAVVALALAPPLMADIKLGREAAALLRLSATADVSATPGLGMPLPGFGTWITSLVPANVMKAAADGAMLPLIVFTLLLALSARAIEATLRQSLIDFFAAVASTMTRIVDWIIALAPIGIFALVVGATTRAGVGLVGAMAHYVMAISLLLVLFALLMYPVANIVGRVPMGWFVRGVLPAQAVALSSSSSLASLPALVEGARALGLPAPITGVVLPLSVSTFKVATPITWMVGTLFLAKLYGVSLGATSLLTIAITAVALSLTIPGVPQGAQLLLAPLLLTYRIPPEGVALLIAVDTIPDVFGTMTNVTGDLVVATVVARFGVAKSPSEAASSPDA